MLLLTISLLDDEQRDLVEKIFKEDKDYFFRVANKILTSKTDAEDAVAEALLRIVENLDKISKLSRPEMRAYCITIVKNCANAKFRRDAGIVFTDEPDLFMNHVLTDPATIYEKKMDKDMLKTILSSFSEGDQQLIFLRFEDRMGYKEIGKVLGITEDTARKRGLRIGEKLRKQISEKLVSE
ncbi:MAG: sigma-70 family RNA polymerase sigma factor [Lachnospiraceae bacterium]|nr:sigma-70 family RNA polymerase sigma factor [Lachnospiraceae bacterium]